MLLILATFAIGIFAFQHFTRCDIQTAAGLTAAVVMFVWFAAVCLSI